MRRRRQAPPEFERTIDANQLVGVNFRLARELRTWTQENTAKHLAPYLGHVLPKASISAIERGLDRDRRRVFNAQELVAFALAFDVPIMWFFLPVPGTEAMRLEGTDEPVTNLLRLLLGRQNQMEFLRRRLGGLRDATDEPVLDEVVEGLVGSNSWKHLEATRLLAIEELAWRKAGKIERLVADMRAVLADFDGAFTPLVPPDVEQAAFEEWKPSQVYRKTSEVLLGRKLFRHLYNYEAPSRPALGLLLSREDLPLEDWIDVDDPELLNRVAAVYDRIEEQLADTKMPPPPDDGPNPDE